MAPSQASSASRSLTDGVVRGTAGVAEGPALTIGLAGVAGLASSFVSCPAELVMLHQQKSGGGMAATVTQLVADHGALSLWRGMAPTMMRECLWVGAYLGTVPVLEDAYASTEVRAPRATHLTAASALQHPSDSLCPGLSARRGYAALAPG